MGLTCSTHFSSRRVEVSATAEPSDGETTDSAYQSLRIYVDTCVVDEMKKIKKAHGD